jgi:hypothetical protein
MDQYISVFGESGRAMLLDCRTLERRLIKMDSPSVTVLIANSNVRHELGSGEYAIRRASCQAAVAVLHKANPRISSLRDATVNDLLRSRADMDETTFKRAHHAITENDRTLSCVPPSHPIARAKLHMSSPQLAPSGEQTTVCRNDLAVFFVTASSCRAVVPRHWSATISRPLVS